MINEENSKILFPRYKLDIFWDLIELFNRENIQFGREYNTLQINENIFILKFHSYFTGQSIPSFFKIYILKDPHDKFNNINDIFTNEKFLLIYTSNETPYSGYWLKYGPWIDIIKKKIERFNNQIIKNLEEEFNNSDLKNIWNDHQYFLEIERI